MNKKQKKMLARILTAAALLVGLNFVQVTGLAKLGLYLIPYLIIGYDILLKADKMSMANSLELRVPFLDKKMLEVAMQIPAKYRVSREMTKIALRKAAFRQLPPKTANKKKLGFPVPLNDWLKQEPYYRQVAEAFQSEEAKLFFDQAYIMKLLQDHKDGKRGNMKKIWSVYCFLLWYREYFINR